MGATRVSQSRWWQPQLAGRSAAKRAGGWARLQVDAACRLDLALIPAAVAARARIGMLRIPFNDSGSNKLWCPLRQHSIGCGTYAAGSASKREQAGPPWDRCSPGHLGQRCGAVWDVYRLWRDVDLVKQVLPHEAVVGLQGRRQEAGGGEVPVKCWRRRQRLPCMQVHDASRACCSLPNCRCH